MSVDKLKIQFEFELQQKTIDMAVQLKEMENKMIQEQKKRKELETQKKEQEEQEEQESKEQKEQKDVFQKREKELALDYVRTNEWSSQYIWPYCTTGVNYW